jgi:CheY-like chemotaxis protein
LRGRPLSTCLSLVFSSDRSNGLRTKRYGLVISDLDMEPMDGIQLLREIRADDTLHLVVDDQDRGCFAHRDQPAGWVS